ncbi:actin, alpha skeletal muscle 2-like [Phoca vitulina]|uniref:actin, alpha skeletal muscle 2-like n=1 Tax=Phoca vitulina TaxID=9720 RepID=UPI0013965837|nr:actin, alpha skeletal muscle 2-like [Phoca vitulina]
MRFGEVKHPVPSHQPLAPQWRVTDERLVDSVGGASYSPVRVTHNTMNVPLVCDYGSGFSKVGFSGTEAPLAMFPTILGKLRHDNPLVGMQEEDWFIGDEAQKKRGELNLQHPISRATITNWDNMEKIWHHSFYQALRIAPEQHPLMVTEPPLNITSNKEKMSQGVTSLLSEMQTQQRSVPFDVSVLLHVGPAWKSSPDSRAPNFPLDLPPRKELVILFETFNVPALYLANQGVLSLYASGRTSGTTIESGEGMTYFVPVIDGCPLHQSTIQMDMAGQDLTLYLLQLLTDSGHSLVSTGDWEYIRHVKEKCCYVALDFDKEKLKADSPSYAQKYQLPDGQEITLGQEKFLCPEGLFQADIMVRVDLSEQGHSQHCDESGVFAAQAHACWVWHVLDDSRRSAFSDFIPRLRGRNGLGIHMKAFQSVSSCNSALWKVLFGHIVLSGGTSSCSGLRFRMQREIAALVSPTINVKVSTCPSSIYSAWLGGSILCSLSTFKDMWVTSKEYKDIGSSIISRRAL